MTIDTKSLDLSAISSALETRTGSINSSATKIQGMFEIVSSGFDGLDADYLDDKIFNGSKGNLLSKTTLTMDKILEMSEEEISELLKSAENSEEVQEALQKQKQLYSQYVQQFKALQEEIKQLEGEIKNVIVQVEHAQKEQKDAQDNLVDAQKEQKAAQDAYDKAVKTDASANEQAQEEAYKKAEENYNAQDFSNEAEVVSFDKFYDGELGNVDTVDTATKAAQSNLTDSKSDVTLAQRKFDNQTSAVNRLQSNLLNLEAKHQDKQLEMTNLTSNIEKVQTDLAGLEQKAADIAFVEKNKEQLQDVAYNKKPEVIEARQKEGVVFAKTESGKTNPCALNLKEMISCEELALVGKNNLDLDAVVQEGDKYYPKYLIAKGKSDNKFHIYERTGGNGKHGFSSIARLYGGSQSNAITAQGNGYMNVTNHSDDPESGFTEAFYLTTDDDLSNAAFGATYKNYCTSSPLSLDLDCDGVNTSQSIINFDIDGDGFMDRINDSADAVLVFDNDGDGISGEDGSECFGDNTDIDGNNKKDGYKDGFAALKALARKEGLINGKDDNMLDENDIKFLEATHGFKIKANGYNSEAQSLLDLGITQINLATTDETTLVDDFDGRGNQIMYQEGATFIQNGIEKDYADIWHKKK